MNKGCIYHSIGSARSVLVQCEVTVLLKMLVLISEKRKRKTTARDAFIVC